MGYPCNWLVAPAVLYMNPGITKEEFIELLDQTHSSKNTEYKSDQAWDYYSEYIEDLRFHQGLIGLADLLNIHETEEYSKFASPHYDEDGLLINAPDIRLRNRDFKEDHFAEITIHERNELNEPKRTIGFSWDKAKVGSMFEDQYGCKEGIVTKIIEETKMTDDEHPYYKCDMEVISVDPIYNSEKFKTEEEFYSKWPICDPLNMFDWKKEKGNFYMEWGGTNKFLWMKEDNKYYLDPKTFDQIPPSKYLSQGKGQGYTDLILTVEAIKNNAWKVLSNHGEQYINSFLIDFPDVQKSHSKATWDSHTSLFAKKENMNITELLRYRMFLKSNLFKK